METLILPPIRGVADWHEKHVTCLRCAVLLTHKPGKRLYCSRLCQGRSNYKPTPPREKVCPVCESVFSGHGGYRYCRKCKPIIRRFYGMRSRCNNEDDKAYPKYGGRGIRICEEWESDPAAFGKWALANGYRADLSIDRIDNDKGYSPDNCRFTVVKVQGRNRRPNRYVEAFGERKTLADWADDPRAKVNSHTIADRIDDYGWDAGRAITTPPSRKNTPLRYRTVNPESPGAV